MTAKTRTKAVSRATARQFLDKAEEFADAARTDLGAERYSACGLAAVHAAISAADAVTAHWASVVSAADDHLQVVRLLDDTLPTGLPAGSRRQLTGLLQMKNEIEYTHRAINPSEARVLVDQATRFTAWTRRIICDTGPAVNDNDAVEPR